MEQLVRGGVAQKKADPVSVETDGEGVTGAPPATGLCAYGSRVRA